MSDSVAESRPRRAKEIHKATLSLLSDKGMHGITFEEVAKRAGVHRSTLYRWWPDKYALVNSAVRAGYQRLPLPDAGSIRNDLLAELAAIVPTVDSAAGRALTAATIEEQSAELSGLTECFIDAQLERGQSIVTRAIERDEARADTVVVSLFHSLLGAIGLRVFLLCQAFEGTHAEHVVDVLLAGSAPSHTASGPAPAGSTLNPQTPHQSEKK